ncbi:MAG: hypothetical protein JXA20_19540 [Spirochaetes bacterium]|nr:hypothetical protein [Spirochaetota bacterium]
MAQTVVSPTWSIMPNGPGDVCRIPIQARSMSSYIPNSLYCNVGRCLTGENMFHEQEVLCDIAGGITATFPMEQELVSSELRPYIEKYMKRNPGIPIEEQIKFWLYFIDMSCSTLGAAFNYAGVHGGGSPIMEQIAITSQYDINLRKRIIKDLAGIPEVNNEESVEEKRAV